MTFASCFTTIASFNLELQSLINKTNIILLVDSNLICGPKWLKNWLSPGEQLKRCTGSLERRIWLDELG